MVLRLKAHQNCFLKREKLLLELLLAVDLHCSALADLLRLLKAAPVASALQAPTGA